MNPVSQWIDPVEVRRLAEGLMMQTKAPAAPVILADAGFDADFVGFASASPLESPALPPQIISPPAPIAEAPTEPARPEPAPAPSETSFPEKIQHFREWMRHHFSATDLFILDREGTVIFDESGHGRLHFLARSLALTSHRNGAPVANVHMKIAAGTSVEIIPAASNHGWLVLGAVVPKPLSTNSITAVIAELSKLSAPPFPR